MAEGKHDKALQQLLQMGLDTKGSKAEIDLLWQNASPTSSFPAQNLPIDVSEFDILEIAFSNMGNLRIPTKTNGWKSGAWANYPTGGLWVGGRSVRINSGLVSFTDSYTKNHNNATAISNSSCIPTEIYGIKEVQ